MAGYGDDLSALGIATAPDGGVFVSGRVESTTGAIQFTNGLEGAMRFPPADPREVDSDGFLAAFEADGSARWLRVFGTAGSDTPAEVTVAGDIVALAHWPSIGPMIFDAEQPGGTLEMTGSAISTWDAKDGTFREATSIGTPTSALTVGVAAGGTDRLISVTEGVRDRTYGEGDGQITWSGALTHGLVTAWSASGLAWQANQLLDTNPAGGAVRGYWVDARHDGWSVTSGFVAGEATFATSPPRTVPAASVGTSGGDGFVGLVDPSFALQCAYWMPGPDVEDVRAALDEAGGIAVVGDFTHSITFEPGTPREVTLTGESDGFVAYFAPPVAPP